MRPSGDGRRGGRRAGALGVAVLAGALLLAAGCERSRIVSPAEAVANLEAEGTFRFVADSAVEVQGEPVEFEVEGLVDLDRDAARYTSSLSPVFASRGVVAVGRELYAPAGEGGAEGWQRSQRPDGDPPWVAERFLPYDGGGLLALAGLSQATASDGEPWVDEHGRSCARAISEGEADLRYCVDDQGRLRSVLATSEGGSSAVRYEDLGEPVDVQAPPEGSVTDFDTGGG